MTLPHALAVAARLEARDGRSSDALGRLDEALETVQKTGECWYEPELHRLRGDLEWSGGKNLTPDPAAAEASFARAVGLARRQGARLFEVRASARWAALQLAQGRTSEATALLRQACDAAADMQQGREWQSLLDLLADAARQDDGPGRAAQPVHRPRQERGAALAHRGSVARSPDS